MMMGMHTTLSRGMGAKLNGRWGGGDEGRRQKRKMGLLVVDGFKRLDGWLNFPVLTVVLGCGN